MAYERLNLKKDDLLDEAVFKHIDDSFEDLMGVTISPSPNLWSITLTSSDMTGKYYMSGQPYSGTNFDQRYPCTEKIYLAEYAPSNARLVVNLKRNNKYTFYAIPKLATNKIVPWENMPHSIFFYDATDTFLGSGLQNSTYTTILVPDTAVYFRFNVDTLISGTYQLDSILSSINTQLMLVDGVKMPSVYIGSQELVEEPTGKVLQIMNGLFEQSPNLYNLVLTEEDLSGQYYTAGTPYTASDFTDRYQATNKIYLKEYISDTQKLVLDLKRGYSYKFGSVTLMQNGSSVPWIEALPLKNRIFFYDANDNCVASDSIEGLDVITIPLTATYFRFNVAKGSSTFPAILNDINSNLMIVDANISFPTEYVGYGELVRKKETVEGIVTEVRPIFYNIENEIVNIISHYNSTHDLRYQMLKKGPNNIFDYAGFFLVPVTSTGAVSNDISGTSASWSWGGTDSHGPFIIKAVNNADGDNFTSDGVTHTSYFTGGNHGYDNSGSVTDNSATGRTSIVRLFADGKEIVNGSGYCNQVKVYWENLVQASNTTKIDGTGREVLREVHESIFDGYEWKEEIHLYPLEDIIINTWYGIQCIGLSGAWKNGYYKGSIEADANRDLLVFESGTNFNSTSNSKTSNRFTAFDDTKSVELEIDLGYDLGSGYLSNSDFKGFISGSKFYFWIIKGNNTLTQNRCYGLKVYYRFKPVVN